jgi:hypothetical protein
MSPPLIFIQHFRRQVAPASLARDRRRSQTSLQIRSGVLQHLAGTRGDHIIRHSADDFLTFVCAARSHTIKSLSTLNDQLSTLNFLPPE